MPPLPQITIKVDREAAARYGINVADISDLIQTGIGGGAVSQVFIGERRYDTTVRFPERSAQQSGSHRQPCAHVEQRRADPLSQVARIQLQLGESTITRWMNQRNVTVKLNYGGRDCPRCWPTPRESRRRGVASIPKRYRIEWGGDFENEQRAEARFALILGLVLGLMIVLLYAEFGVLRQVLLVLGVVPLATFGGLIALHIAGARSMSPPASVSSRCSASL